MSNALAIAAVTATLKDLLNNGLIDHDLSSIGSFSVTASPPDRVTTGATENNQLNLFLYQVMPNLGWRNTMLPSHDSRGRRVTAPPLALDLHYLLTAYGAQDMNAEVLLGFAMALLHDNPVLTREQLRTALAAPSVDGSLLPAPFGTLGAEALADQIEQVKVTPVYLGSEDLSKLWTAMQARYRPSMAYTVSVVLIDIGAAATSALPVLRRGPQDRGPVAQPRPAPVLTGLRSALLPQQPSLRLGDLLWLEGRHLQAAAGATAVFIHVRSGRVLTLPTQAAPGARLAVQLPDVATTPAAMDVWAPGVYSVLLRQSPPGAPSWDSNAVALALAPRITVSPSTAAAGTIALTLSCTPRLLPEQEVQTVVLLGGRELAGATVTTPADPLLPSEVTVSATGVPVGSHVLRLRVQGIDSLPTRLAGTPPRLEFDPGQMLSVS
jgi:hypothetical protein